MVSNPTVPSSSSNKRKSDDAEESLAKRMRTMVDELDTQNAAHKHALEAKDAELEALRKDHAALKLELDDLHRFKTHAKTVIEEMVNNAIAIRDEVLRESKIVDEQAAREDEEAPNDPKQSEKGSTQIEEAEKQARRNYLEKKYQNWFDEDEF